MKGTRIDRWQAEGRTRKMGITSYNSKDWAANGNGGQDQGSKIFSTAHLHQSEPDSDNIVLNTSCSHRGKWG